MASGSEPIRWARLEPRSLDKSLAPGLEARVHDPLWLFGRQWQFGELNADGDLGTAIVAEISAHIVPLARYRPGRAEDDRASRAYDVAAQPLETVVEAEEVRAAASVRARARAGQQFERLLAAHGVARHAPAFRAEFALTAEAASLDASSRRFTGLLAGRAIDGGRLHAALTTALRPSGGTPPALPPRPAVDDADVPRVRAAAEAWLAWSDSLVTSPAGSNAAWIPDRMEYAFRVEAPAADGTGMLLEAEEYTDGSLDWHTFTGAPSTDATPEREVQVVGPLAVVPTAVTFPGMPASRLWEFEDARVDFGGVEANPEDLGRMLVTEFALVYGADWMLVPLEAPTGSLVRIVSLDVRDTFGRVVRVNPTTALEPAAAWRMFGISPPIAPDGATRGTGAPPDVLLVAPALASGLQGRAIEEVLLLRDEMANMAWAVERSVEDARGLPMDRAAAEYERRPDPPPASAASEALAYRLRTDVPHHWLPLLPLRLRPGDPSMTLRLGALPFIQPDGAIVPIRPRGHLLAPAAPDAEVILREEEVPREGARVTRAYQLARWFDGTTFLWLGRRKAVGRGEGSSGLRFDVADQR
jgi:hypothetical protein